MTREETARAFAEAMGFDYCEDGGPTFGYLPIVIPPDQTLVSPFGIPIAADPLHAHLAFVGRVAEALDWTDFYVSFCGKTTQVVIVQHVAPVKFGASARDPSWAAMLAAIAAKEGSA